MTPAPKDITQMATVVTSPRNPGAIGPYQTPNVDKPVASTRAPPGARQNGNSTAPARRAATLS